MKGFPLREMRLFFITSLLTGALSLLMIQNSHADALEALHAALPNRLATWKAQPAEDRLFDQETIFDYINGAGEVYRAYNMRKCLSRRYNAPKGPSIVLDIFDMRSSEDAFGVFTHDQDGEELHLGQGALYRAGWLRFWKDRFFVSIYLEGESETAEKAVRELAKEVAALIRSRGPKPRILTKLPLEGLQGKSIRYLHHYVVLNYHYYLSDENILNLGPHTDAALAGYQRDKKYAQLLLVVYSNKGEAEEAYTNFLRHYLPEAKSTRPVLLENNKWSAAALEEKLLVIVLDAESQRLAASLINEVLSLD